MERTKHYSDYGITRNEIENYYNDSDDQRKLILATRYIEKYCDTDDFFDFVGNCELQKIKA